MTVTFNQRVAMQFPAQGISNYVCLARMIVHLEVIILDQLEPSSLTHIQLRLSEDVLKTFMISVDIAHIVEQIISLGLQSMNNCSEF